ncbi:MAG: hypothetical protein JSW45_02130, partial [Thiotrichales bacterium]
MHYQTRPLPGPGTGQSGITALYQLNPEHYPYVLASTAAGINSRYDILLAHPQRSLELSYESLHQHGPGFLESLHDWWLADKADNDHTENTVPADSMPLYPVPFTGGWFIYLG